MKKLSCYLLVLMLATGCGVVGSFKDMDAQMNNVKGELAKTMGAPPEIGWSIQSGELARLTVVFTKPLNGDLSVSEVSEAVYKAVAAHVDLKPQSLVVSMVVNQKPLEAALEAGKDGDE